MSKVSAVIGGQNPSDIDALMGSVIREKRLYVGLTQQQLAQKTGVSFQQIQKYETGANRVSISRLFLICSAFDVKPSDLIAELEDLASVVAQDDDASFQRQSQFARMRSARRAVKSLASINDQELLKALVSLISVLEQEEQKS